MTVEQLRSLANDVSASVGNGTLLLYSGGVGPVQSNGFNQFSAGSIATALASGTNVYTVQNTEVHAFLISEEL